MAAPEDAPLEISAPQLAQALQSASPPLLVDVREPDEQLTGILATARQAPLAELSQRLREWRVDLDRPVVLYCASGRRSAVGARRLLSEGFRSVRSLQGGIAHWRDAGLPVVTPPQDLANGLTPEQAQRYARQIRLPGFGLAGQRRLLRAKVLCIGAGGLGSPACLYLAAAGVGEIGIVDDDVVALSNLHRQILHNTERVGMAKTESAQRTISKLNPEIRVQAHRVRLDAANAADLLADYDVVLDGSDNFKTRYIVNDAALRLRKPVVFGAVLHYEGQVSVFDGSPCYRCLFPTTPPPGAAPSCEEAGVLGVVPGIVGTLQAAEVLKLLLGVGDTLRGRLLIVDALTMRFSTLVIRPDPECRVCGCAAEQTG